MSNHRLGISCVKSLDFALTVLIVLAYNKKRSSGKKGDSLVGTAYEFEIKSSFNI
jgi:hypothetical protein